MIGRFRYAVLILRDSVNMYLQIQCCFSDCRVVCAACESNLCVSLIFCQFKSSSFYQTVHRFKMYTSQDAARGAPTSKKMKFYIYIVSINSKQSLTGKRKSHTQYMSFNSMEERSIQFMINTLTSGFCLAKDRSIIPLFLISLCSICTF